MRQRFYKTDKQLVDHCVETFLAVTDSALEQARGNAMGLDGLDNDKAIAAGRLAWSALSHARLFCFEPERWAALYDAADRYATESLAGLKHTGRSPIRLRPKDVFANGGALWGITEAEALARGYLDPNGEGMTVAGKAALQKYVASKLTPQQQRGYAEMREVYDLAVHENRPEVAAMAAAQMLDVLTQPPSADFEKLLSAYEDYGVRWSFPEKLPFDACFFCFGPKLNLTYSSNALHARIHASELADLGARKVFLLGYLVAWEGETPFIFTAVGFDLASSSLGKIPVGLIKTYEDGEWTQPMSMDPWIITMLVKAINDHQQITQSYGPSLTSRTARKIASKRAGQILPLPAPFYLVNLEDEFISAPLHKVNSSSGRPVEWSHRWDVRGHEVVRVERGQLPVAPKEIQKLQKRGYRIYEGMSLTAEDAGRLLKRGIRAPAPSEWIAVLSYWRDSFVKGPQEKPYVPAARVEA